MTTGAAVVYIAGGFRGQRYSTAPGRCDPQSGHKDCSGLVCAAYTAAGHDFGCLASKELQDRVATDRVALADAPWIAGAILTLGHQDGPHGHAGLSVGDGVHCIETPSAEGHKVGFSPFWRNRWDYAGKVPGVDYSGAPPAPFPPTGTTYPTLQLGDKGGAVVSAQACLVHHGAHIRMDGEFGPLTQAAVITFQGEMRHFFGKDVTGGVDGVIGPKTWYWLARA